MFIDSEENRAFEAQFSLARKGTKEEIPSSGMGRCVSIDRKVVLDLDPVENESSLVG